VKALEDFDKALELDPMQADARLRRAFLRLHAKDRDRAKADLDALDNALAPQAQMRLAMAHLYLDLEQPAQALAQLNQWLPAHPSEVRRDAALNGRCRARTMLGIELDKALDDCDAALDSDAKNATYLDSRGWVYLRLGKYVKALSDFDRSIEVRPKSAWSLYGRGLTRTRLGDAAQGETDLTAARKAQADIDLKVARAGLMIEPAPKP
jgi:tetratricopeptide (TPR) repeat protein